MVDQSREKVAGSPPFDTNVVPTADHQREVYEHYGYPYPQGSYPGEAERASDEAPPSLTWSGGRNRQADDRPRAPGACREGGAVSIALRPAKV